MVKDSECWNTHRLVRNASLVCFQIQQRKDSCLQEVTVFPSNNYLELLWVSVNNFSLEHELESGLRKVWTIR